MKSTLLLLPVIALLAACSTPADQRTISAHIEGAGGRTLYFDRFINNKPVHSDSVVLDADGKGSIVQGMLPLDFYALSLSPNEMTWLVLDSTDALELVADVANMRFPRSVSGSAHTTALHEFLNQANAFNGERDAMIQRARSNSSDTAAIERIAQLNNSFYDLCKDFVVTNKTSPAAIAALDYLNQQEDLQLMTEVRDALSSTMAHSEFYRGLNERVQRTGQELAAARQQEEHMRRLESMIPVGSLAPDFSQATPQGGELALSSLRGKVVLIDFWASWCKPCLVDMPHVRGLYSKYNKRGFEILGVSLDRDKNAWTKAIVDHQLPWKHVSDLGFWSNAAAQLYNVQSIPYTVLLDKDGKVIAKNLRGPSLDAKLAEVFP